MSNPGGSLTRNAHPESGVGVFYCLAGMAYRLGALLAFYTF